MILYLEKNQITLKKYYKKLKIILKMILTKIMRTTSTLGFFTKLTDKGSGEGTDNQEDKKVQADEGSGEGTDNQEDKKVQADED